jgi:EmrB/QacA subfamily drug resistance transporter
MLADMTDNASAGISKKVTLIITTTASFVLPFLISSVNIALPTMGREFAMEAVVMGWVSTVYFLAVAMSQVPFGRLADIHGRKKIFTYGVVLSTLASFACAFSNSVFLLIFFRALQGIGSGMTFNTSVAILTSVFPAEERGRALGISMTGTYIGISMGPLIGGILTEHFGWQSIFFLSALLGLMLTVLVFWRLKGEWAEARGERFDVLGSIILGVAVAVGMYGFSALPTTLGIVLFVAGVLCMLVFVRWEARTDSPILNLSLFRKNTVFVFSNLAALITYSSTFAVTFLLSLYLQYTGGLSPQTAGLILVVSSVVTTIFTPIAGRLSDRIEPRLVAAVGMMFLGVALLVLVFSTGEMAMGLIIAALAIYGIGIGLFSSPNTNAVMGSVDRRFLGVASGTLGTMRTSGMMLSMGIVMILFSIYIGDAQITPEYYPAFLTSMRTGFIIFVVLSFGGIFAQLAGIKVRGAQRTNP